MTRVNILLLIAVLGSALYLVQVQYESRRLYVELEKAHNEARKLEQEQERLRVEKRAQATPARVERIAREQLQMRGASPAISTYVTLGSAQSAARPPEGARPLPPGRGEAQPAKQASLGEDR